MSVVRLQTGLLPQTQLLPVRRASTRLGTALPAPAPHTLAALLGNAAQAFPQQKISYLQSDGCEVVQSYAELRLDAERMLGGLRTAGLAPKAIVFLHTDLLQEFVPAFWACLLGGWVPLPTAVPPTYDPASAQAAKLRQAWQKFGCPHVLTSPHLSSKLSGVLNDAPAPLRLTHIEQLRGYAPDPNWETTGPDELALILLTSGSTGQAKGVMLSPRNILSSIAATSALQGFDATDVSLNWMPLDHGGSLLRCLLRCVYLGCRQIHAPTQRVLQDPLRWLDWIEHYRATITWAPNFAFALINERVAAAPERRWDLTCLRSILNTAEPVVPRTARRFLSLLQPHGLAPESMHMSWGMAETSSGVTWARFSLADSSDEDAFVDLGRALPAVQLRIVDDKDEPLPEGSIGRLQVRGPTVTAGYYNDPVATAEAFSADGWFKTGDLGLLRGRSLTLTGREKDVIIINGLNYYSHEIESLVEQLPGIKLSYTAACALRDERSATDRLAIFFCPQQLSEETLLELIRQIRGRIVQSLGISPACIIPVQAADIPKTSLGKIQRAQLQQRLRSGEFDIRLQQLAAAEGAQATSVGPRDETERQIAQVWRAVLGLTRLGVRDNFFELGGHSLLATQAVARLQSLFLIPLQVGLLFEAPTVEKFAAALRAQEPQPGQVARTAQVLRRLETLSPAEVQLLLRTKKQGQGATAPAAISEQDHA